MDVAASPAAVESVESVAQSPAAAPSMVLPPIASQAALAPQAARGEVTAAPMEVQNPGKHGENWGDIVILVMLKSFGGVDVMTCHD